ncbi:MAG: hypothetical protein HYR72_15890 [Deltaproteobacteria bacterium]|nr:hypothetical protein [Deltaproteobacteria bacterium]MBI3390232.1 hypothetical protein [Deltaproteobacteria bacterium]
MTLRLRIALFVLYLEALSNIAAGVVFMAAPALFAGHFLGHVLTPSSVEMGRWYGVTLFIMSAMQLAVLQGRDQRTMRWVLLAMLSGDILQTGVAFHSLRLAPATMLTATVAIVLSVIYALARVVWLHSAGRVSSNAEVFPAQVHVSST